MSKHNCLVARSALVALLSYVTVMLTCGYTEARHLPSLGAEGVEAAAVTPEIPSSGREEDFCELIHEQLFTQQAFSAGSISIAAKISDVLLASVEPEGQSAELDGFRPPGSAIAAHGLSFRLYSVLRI